MREEDRNIFRSRDLKVSKSQEYMFLRIQANLFWRREHIAVLRDFSQINAHGSLLEVLRSHKQLNEAQSV